MHFQNTNVLWGLLALLAPIIIHYFNFRRLKKVNFSDISLLKEVNTVAKNFSEVKNKWVLLSRILAFTCLILAFANPYFGEKPTSQNQSAFVYIDNSASMQQINGNNSNLTLGINQANKLIDLLPKTHQYYVISNDFGSGDFEKRNASNAKNAISRIEVSPQFRSMNDVLGRINNLYQKDGVGLNNTPIFVFSDFQKSTLGNLQNLTINPKTKVNLVQMGDKNLNNVMVDSVWLSNPFLNVKSNNTLNVSIKNWGEKAINGLVIRLQVNGLVQNGVPINLEAKANGKLTFDIGQAKGIIEGKVSFDDQPVVFDNQFYFVINPSPKIKIVHLESNTSGANSAINQVFQNDSLFQLAKMPAGNVNYEILKTANLLVLEEIGFFDNNLTKSIDEFTKSGGTVWYIPAQKTDLNSLPNCLKGKITANDLIESTTLKWQGKNNTFFNDVFENQNVDDQVKTANVKVLYKLSGEKILETKGGQGFLTYSSQSGKVFTLASPISSNFGDIAKNAIMVPMAYKIAQNSLKAVALCYRFGGPVLVFENKNYSAKTVLALKKGKESFIPLQSFANNQITMEIPKATEWELKSGLQPGIFEVWNGNALDCKLAINFDKAESDLEILNEQSLAETFKNNANVKVWNGENMSTIQEALKSQNQQKPWWKFFVILALAFVALEVLLIRFWKPKA